jgi:hypothetical protein
MFGRQAETEANKEWIGCYKQGEQINPLILDNMLIQANGKIIGNGKDDNGD